MRRMNLCPTCGNKRCPRSQWHGYECSGSNEPDQTPAWAASDGTVWQHAAPSWQKADWTGWEPGEEGVWFLTDEEFRRVYPEAPEALGRER